MTPRTMSAFNLLATGEFYDRHPDKAELLKGTPFYSKRTTLTGKQLQNKPLYRTISLLNKVAISVGIPEADWQTFLDWSETTLSKFERDHQEEVQKFTRTYGSQYNFQHLLLTNRNAINLYIKEFKDR